jgi:uncharacterized protein YneF (UPF0154 family)
MSLSGRASLILKSAALWGSVATAVLCIALAALGFLIAGFFLWVAQHFSNPAAAVITGGVLFVIAGLTGFIGGLILRYIRRKQQPGPLDLGGSLGMAARLAGILIRQDPKKAIILSLIAGALTEYLTSERE